MTNTKIDPAKLLGFRLTDAEHQAATQAKVGTIKPPPNGIAPVFN